MRILIDARYLDGSFSGIGTYSRGLIENLADIDHTNEYTVMVRPKCDALRVGNNFRVITYKPQPVSLATLTSLGALVDDLKVDLMHSLFPLAPLRMKTPLMITMHDLQPFMDPDFSGHRATVVQLAYRLFYGYAYPATLKKAKWIINDSYHTRDCVEQMFPVELPKLIVVHPGLEQGLLETPTTDATRVLEEYDLHGSYILYYGSTRPNKNIPTMLRGFRRYLDESNDTETDFVLILKKDRFYRDIGRTIRNEGLKNRVRVLGQVPPDHRQAILAGANAFLFATKYEGFGFPALEAMAAGVPVIAGDSGALPEVCSDAAQFVEPDSPEEIGASIAAVLNRRDSRHAVALRGEERARAFSWRETAERIHDIYRLLF